MITPEETPDLIAAAKKTLELRGDDGTGWSLAWKINFRARLGDGDHAYRHIERILRYAGGSEGKFNYATGGGTYAKALPNILAFGPVFPGDEAREHKPDEYITVENLLKNTQIIAAAMYEMAK